MELLLQREPSQGGKTPGTMTVDGEFACFTLEDEVREVPGKPVAYWKVPGQTAIPAGRYRVAMTFSNRFQRVMIQLLNVPGFSGVRVHSGATELDTDGCVLVGDQYAGGRLSGGKVRGVLAWLEERVEEALEAREEVWITVEDADV